MNRFYASALKVRVSKEDQSSRLLVIYYFIDLARERLAIEFFRLNASYECRTVPFGRVLPFREQLLSSDFATHAVDYHGQPITEIVIQKIAEAFPGWDQQMEPVDLDMA